MTVLRAVLVVLFFPIAAIAQDMHMPAQTVTPDAWVTALDGNSVRMVYDGVGNDFLAELQDRDVAGLFTHGPPPPDRTLATADIIVVARDDWAGLVAFWDAVGLDAFTNAVRPYASLTAGQPHVSVISVTAPDGHAIRAYNFVRVAEGMAQSERCMARDVLHDAYVGIDVSAFNSFACSQVLK